ncbi:MAG: hypothetical protein ABJN69_04985 [Hellea sp.]
MIRTLAIILALSTSFMALSAVEASAQVTDQTDQSEEDWRKSKKKRDTSDIFEDILNRRSTGQGNGTYPQNPIDNLPEESRRHLMKERAKVIAESDPGTTPDAPYSPSEAAKTDPELAEQEKEAWTVIMTDMKGGSSSGQGQPGTGPNKIAIAGQGSGQGGGQGDSQRNSSVMRGGSSQSVADIMAQIKGLKSAGGGMGGSIPTGSPSRQGPLGSGTGQQQGPQGQAPSGQGSSGQGASGQSSGDQSQSQSQTGADAKAAQQAQAQAQAQANSDAAGAAAAQAQAQADSAAQAAQQAQAEAQAKGDSTSKMKADIANDIAQMAQEKADSAAQKAAQAKAEAQAQSAAKAQQDAHTAAHVEAIEKANQAPESIGPLDRIKREREERIAGTQTSASDYLKTSK